MADDGIRALAPFVATPGAGAYTTMFTVPAGKEWTIRFLRAVAIGDGGVISVSLNNSTTQIAINEFVQKATASASGAKNILGPDFLTLPPGSSLLVMAGAASTVRVVASVTERDLV